MPSTTPLYYEKPSIFVTEARLLGISGEADSPILEFDRTIFYPEGGGQPYDQGWIGGIPVAHVQIDEGRVFHHLLGPLPSGLRLGSTLEMRVDEGRRRDHSEQHSGQHLISATLLRLFGEATKSFHLGNEASTIDLDGPFLSEDGRREAEETINASIVTDYPLITHICPPEELSSFTLRRKPPVGEGVIRVVEIDGIDFTPCCGTHLGRTGELRLVLLLGAERYKGLTRLSFVAGQRAVALALRQNTAMKDVSRALGAKLEDIGSEAGRVVGRLKSARSELRSLEKARAAAEAEEILRSPRAAVLVLRFQDRSADSALESCKALATRGQLALAAAFTELTAIAVAPDGKAGLERRLGPIAEAVGGKGGGGPAFFRASFPNTASLESFLLEVDRNT